MRNIYLLNSICFLFFISSCASNKDLAKKSVFTFTENGDQYQIVCVNTKSGEGTNYLAKVDNKGQQLTLARDLDQDGSIDLILKGDQSLSEANMIYNLGIDKAKELGNYAERVSLRTFEHIENHLLYTIKTYLIDEENASNLFLISDKSLAEEYIFIDTNADGILDSVEKGTMSLDLANQYYTKILQVGLDNKKIDLRNNTYRVKEVNILESATALN